MKAAERKRVEEYLHSTQAVIATGKYVEKGFYLPRLDTLFLAMPIAWKGTLIKLTTEQPTTENLERYITWKLCNKGKALKRLIQLLNETVW